jgi:hypothetical protein
MVLNESDILSMLGRELAERFGVPMSIADRVAHGRELEWCYAHLRDTTYPDRVHEIGRILYGVYRCGIEVKFIASATTGKHMALASEDLWMDAARNLAQSYGPVVVTDVLGNAVAEIGKLDPATAQIHPGLASAIASMLPFDRGLAQNAERIATMPLERLPQVVAALYLRAEAYRLLVVADRARDTEQTNLATSAFHAANDAIVDLCGFTEKHGR